MVANDWKDFFSAVAAASATIFALALAIFQIAEWQCRGHLWKIVAVSTIYELAASTLIALLCLVPASEARWVLMPVGVIGIAITLIYIAGVTSTRRGSAIQRSPTMRRPSSSGCSCGSASLRLRSTCCCLSPQSFRRAGRRGSGRLSRCGSSYRGRSRRGTSRALRLTLRRRRGARQPHLGPVPLIGAAPPGRWWRGQRSRVLDHA